MENNNLSIYDDDYLKSKIYIIRGVQVMLDADLADIYGYTTKRFNEQVKNNIERFDEEMRFQLTNSEYDILRSKISTSKLEKRGGRQYLPYAFTDPNIKKDYLFYNGQTVEADIAYSEIYSYAKKTIHIIDNYISLKTLVLLKAVRPNVKVTIFSDNVNHGLHQTELEDFKREYPNVDITLKTTGGIYHDRYIFIDSGTKNEMIFHCGGSSKDGGKRVTSITKVEDVVLYQNIINSLFV